MKTLLRTLAACAIIGLLTVDMQAQNRFDALRFSNTSPGNDALSLSTGNAPITSFHGFGSITQNPASAALANESYFSFSIGNRNVEETSSFMNSSTVFDDNQTSISSLGYLYQFPTITGSMVLGGSYTQIADFNRAMSIDVLNEQHTIVDHFLLDPGDQYFTTAFNAFAIEYDDFFDEYFNVLRADGFFRGMNQYAEIRERGQIGEYSMFFSTEFQPGLYIGGSVGLLAGNYRYRRTFIEEDLLNRYQNAGYDVDVILNEDKIDASISGINAKIGIIYEPFSGARFGATYTTASKMNISENYSTFIQTTYKTFDQDGFNRYEDTFRGDINYTVTRPSILSFGVGITNLPFIDIDASVERIDYTKMEMSGLGTINDRNQNQAIRTDFTQVNNTRVGVIFKSFGNFVPRIGYAYHPSTRKAFDAGTSYISGGAQIKLGNDISMDIGLQFASWDDELDLYNHFNGVAVASQNVSKFQGMIGFTFGF